MSWEKAQELLSETETPAPFTPNQALPITRRVNATKNSGCGWGFCSYANELLNEDYIGVMNVFSVLNAEALAIKMALEQARGRGYHSLEVFSDCQVLVNLLKNGEEYNELFGVLSDIRLISLDFSNISFHYIPRSANMAADTLAKRALFALNGSVS